MLRYIVLALSVVALGVAAFGCGSMFIHGARLVGSDTPTAGALGRWEVPACTGSDGRPITPPAGTHYLLLKSAVGTELFEQGADGSGSIIENQWNDSAGTHYYTWVQEKGWEFIIPGPGQPGLRRVYITGTTQGRPSGIWVAQCPMVPVQ
jgi:hypothetical protein